MAPPSDINQALKLGDKYQKFFSAGALGGPSSLNAMAAPYLSQGVRFLFYGRRSLRVNEELFEAVTCICDGGICGWQKAKIFVPVIGQA